MGLCSPEWGIVNSMLFEIFKFILLILQITDPNVHLHSIVHSETCFVEVSCFELFMKLFITFYFDSLIIINI